MKPADALEDRILRYLRRHVPAERVGHILGVARTAEAFARKHGFDPKKARLAALCHDVARRWDARALVRYARRHSVPVPDRAWTCEHQPMLLHGYVGAHLARTLFGIRDRDVLSAVARHSLGHVRMTPFDRLIYAADLLAPDRKFRGVGALRRMALTDLDRTFREGIRIKMAYVVQKEGLLHPYSLKVWNALQSRKEGGRA